MFKWYGKRLNEATVGDGFVALVWYTIVSLISVIIWLWINNHEYELSEKADDVKLKLRQVTYNAKIKVRRIFGK